MSDKYYRAQDIMDQAIGTDAYFQIKSILTSLTPADVVSRAAYDQVAWERDLAVHQLREDYGVGLGEKGMEMTFLLDVLTVFMPLKMEDLCGAEDAA